MNRIPPRFIALSIACAASGCSDTSFLCEDDNACVRDGEPGTCEPDGFCSFADAECTSGRRYAQNQQNPVGGQCVAPDIATSTTGLPPPTSSETSPPPTTTSLTTSDTTSSTTDAAESSSDAESSTGDEPPPPPANLAFVTSTTYVGGTLSQAVGDAACAERAAAAGLEGTYVAWLSSDETDAIARLADARGWQRTDGRPFGDRPIDIGQGRVGYPLNRDEFDMVQPNVTVVTGTNDEGENSPFNCENWTDTTDANNFRAGYSGQTYVGWTSGFTRVCDTEGHLYCFGVDREQPVSFPDPAARIAFATQTEVPGTAGVEAFDAQCQAEADAAGLTGEFVALVAVDDSPAAARLELDGLPWKNTLGVRLVDDPADIAGEHILAPPGATASGTPITGRSWIGALGAGADPDDNCGDWSTPTTGRRGIVNQSDQWVATGGTANCDEPQRLMCFER
ncbi:MAG: hypothetical protein AAGA54_31690 [Myxococcota bacterium]